MADRESDIRELRRLIDAFPDDPRYLLKLGDLMQKLGRVGDAVDAYARAGDVYERQGFGLKFIALGTHVLGLDPARTGIRLRLGSACASLGLVSDAVEHLERARDEYAARNDALGLCLVQQELDRIAGR